MKKIIIMILVVSGYCFCQTGILTEKDRSAMGLWGSYATQIECNYCTNSAFSLSFDYMTDSGLELEVGLVKSDLEEDGVPFDEDSKFAGLAYHLKGDINNVAFGIAKMNTEITSSWYYGSYDYDTETFSVAFYNNNGFLFQVQKIRIPDFDSDYELLTFGNYWKGQTLSWGLTYSASWDLFDAFIEDRDLEYLKYGNIGVVVGSVF